MSRKRFDDLRAAVVTKAKRLGEHDTTLRSKYGPGWSPTWLSRGEQVKRERLGAALQKAADIFCGNLALISPRDWSYGVPTWWLYEKLTYDDAVRPVNESLSVVPPLAYGATGTRT